MKHIISNFNFGQLDARREYNKAHKYFTESFLDPVSLSTETISNSQNFIVIGKKGSGKTAALLHRMDQQENIGYATSFISFFDELTPDEARKFSQSHTFDFVNFDNTKSITDVYDFREIWKNFLYVKIAQLAQNKGIDDPFTNFANPSKSRVTGLLNNIKRGMKIRAQAPAGIFDLAAELDLSKINFDEDVSITDFNRICESLFLKYGDKYKCFIVIDELIISHYNTKTDEYKLKIALIRDLIKAICNLNDLACKYSMDVHIACNLRPEVRDLLNSVDAEIGKIVDDSDTHIQWYSAEDQGETLLNILKSKIIAGSPYKSEFHIDDFLPKTFSLGSATFTMKDYLRLNTWHRPRDVIRFLKSYQKKNPQHTAINEDGIKNSLNEYSRASAKELLDEVSVWHEVDLEMLQQSISRKNYNTYDDFCECILKVSPSSDTRSLAKSLFDAGVVGNIDSSANTLRHFWSYQGEEFLDESMSIRIHPALWKYFNVEHK